MIVNFYWPLLLCFLFEPVDLCSSGKRKQRWILFSSCRIITVIWIWQISSLAWLLFQFPSILSMMTKLGERDILFPAFVFSVCSVSNLTSISNTKVNPPDNDTFQGLSAPHLYIFQQWCFSFCYIIDFFVCLLVSQQLDLLFNPIFKDLVIIPCPVREPVTPIGHRGQHRCEISSLAWSHYFLQFSYVPCFCLTFRSRTR